jgi:FkbM family methyltransferase
MNEALDIKIMRLIVQRWPFPRGKGLLLRLFRPLLRRRPFLFSFGNNVLVPGNLEDWLINHSFLEGPDSAFCLSWSLIRPGDTVIDVGGNVGLWCMTAARNCGDGGVVHVFEPHDANYRQLQRNLEMNEIRNSHAHKFAVSDTEGEAEFFAAAVANSGLGRLAARTGVLVPDSKVQTVVLDRFLVGLGIRSFDFLKIDVEGAEALVLSGAKRYLAEVGPIVLFEMNPVLASAFGQTAKNIGAMLQSCGYRIFEYLRGKMVPIDMTECVGHHDLFALKPAHANRSLLFKGLF